MRGYIRLKTDECLSDDEVKIIDMLEDEGFIDMTDRIEFNDIEANLQANPSLGSILGSNLQGSPKIIYDEDALGGANVMSVVDEWSEFLSAHINDPDLLNFEFAMRDKIGPLSYRKPLVDRFSSIVNYWKDIKGDRDISKSKRLFKEGESLLLEEFKSIKGNVRVKASINNILDDMELSTSAGYPSMFKKNEHVLSSGKTKYYQMKDFDVMGVDEKEHNYFMTSPLVTHLLDGDIVDSSIDDMCIRHPAILGWRGQEGGLSVDKVKQRVVWMFPMSLSILELGAYQPLIKAVQTKNLVPGYNGQDAVDIRMTALFDSKREDDPIICTDFTTFDTHFNGLCQFITSRLLSKILTRDRSSIDFLCHVFNAKYNIPLLISPGIMLTGGHGMASGSGGTNFDETLFHRFLQHVAAYNDGAELNLNSQCLGDDGVISYPGCTVESVVETYTAFGLDMNLDKQTVSNDWCVYLKRYYHKNHRIDNCIRGVYSTMRALGKLFFRERYYKEWTDKDQVLRNLSILENCCWHPLFTQFVDFIYSLNPSALGLGKDKVLFSLLRVDTSAMSTKQYVSYVQKFSNIPIMEWHIVQLLLAKYS